jgi:hypothetical protein
MSDETNTSPKPGYKTTEFWLAFAASLIGAAFASGIIPTDSSLEQVLGLAATVLASLGYTVSRTLVKK